MTTQIITNTENWVKQQLAGDSSGHDWWHIHRVRLMTLRLANEEKANSFISEMAALLHDAADWKLIDEQTGLNHIIHFLNEQGLQKTDIDNIISIVKNVSYKGAGVATNIDSIEGKVVQDADRLDAIGAIGIGRAFAYGGNKGRPMWNPEQKAEMHQSFDDYKKSNSNTINHFYEKLLLLKDRMNTVSAKRIAEARHLFLQQFLDRFIAEWNGDM